MRRRVHLLRKALFQGGLKNGGRALGSHRPTAPQEPCFGGIAPATWWRKARPARERTVSAIPAFGDTHRVLITDCAEGTFRMRKSSANPWIVCGNSANTPYTGVASEGNWYCVLSRAPISGPVRCGASGDGLCLSMPSCPAGGRDDRARYASLVSSARRGRLCHAG